MSFPKFSLIFCISILLFCQAHAIAQVVEDKKTGPPSPSAEKFEPASLMAVPWRWTGCHILYPEPGCVEISSKEFQAADKNSLYDADGSLWYRFSTDRQKADYFLKQPKAEFVPFATYPRSPAAVSLPIVAESPNWYEVEVNKKTHLTKYISKSDKEWVAEPWEGWLKHEPQITVNFKKTPLLEKPDGAEAEEGGFVGDNRVKYLKGEGEWAYIRFYVDKEYKGWIRWRKGREILIGCAYNNFEVPRVDANVPSK
jgi:hypothetical protein